MADRCPAHDDCLERIHSRIESLESKLEDSVKLTTALLHSIEIANKKHEWELEQLKEQLREKLASMAVKKTDWTRFFVDLLRDMIKWGFFAGGAAVWWAVRNGYTGSN